MSISIDGFVIDVGVSVVNDKSTEVTDYEVEDSPDVSDNIRAKPQQLRITGVVTDSPLSDVSRPEGEVPSDAAFAFFTELWLRGEPVEIVTWDRTYPSMALMSMSETVDERTGNAFQFVATFKQLTIVDSEFTTILVERPRQEKNQKRGQKESKDAPETTEGEARSIIDASIGDSVRAGLGRLGI